MNVKEVFGDCIIDLRTERTNCQSQKKTTYLFYPRSEVAWSQYCTEWTENLIEMYCET
jgi:hypothetical protein